MSPCHPGHRRSPCAQRHADTDTLRREATAIDAAIPILSMRTIEPQIDNNLMDDRLMTTLSGFFGVLALLLAATPPKLQPHRS